MKTLPGLLLALFTGCLTLTAQPRRGGAAQPATPAERLATVKVPSGWKAVYFAGPPEVSYPVSVATSPNGDVFVAIDENSSLGARPGRGRVVRCTDTNGDGLADKFSTFAEMDSPRGLWFDDSTLYVMHPPLLQAFHDDNGDGVADRKDVLVTGLAYDLRFRGADHTVNGIRMGIDGFLYIAVGDYGATNAVGKDGTAIQLYGGGIARVRPDGTGLEIVSRGQRNIVDVAISSELDLFTRDNTNDGDGWDVRLSHVIYSGQYGYPTLFRNFADETVRPLADYGGGSPTGALFLDEPGFPAGFGTALYTVEWGRNAILRHPLSPDGAGWKAGQESFIEMPRPTDMDVDGSGFLYVASWLGGQYNYGGPNIGYVVRVEPPGHTARPFPDLKKSSDAQLLDHLASPSAFTRLYAQREMLRRGAKPPFASGLERLAAQHTSPAVRVAAIFTLQQLLGAKSHDAMLRLARQENVREFALRALADDRRDAAAVPAKPFVDALKDANARVRLQAVTALGRLDKADAAVAMLPLTADADPLIQHAAINALVSLRAVTPSLAAFDSPGGAALRPGAARVLQALHEPAVVDGVIAKLGGVKDAASRRLLLQTLARLFNREAEWTGSWWGTRPDTTGPYFKPVKWAESDKIASAFKNVAAQADAETLLWLLTVLQKNRADVPDVTAAAVRLARTDEKARAALLDTFANATAMPDELIAFFGEVAASVSEPAIARANAIRVLARFSAKPAALEVAVAALTSQENLPADLDKAWEDFARNPSHSRNVTAITKLTEAGSPGQRTLAYAILANVSSARGSDQRSRTAATRAVDAAWQDPERVVLLLRAITRLRLDAYAARVRELASDSRSAVAAAAKEAGLALKLDLPAAPAAGPLLESLSYEDVLNALAKTPGDAKRGEDLFTKAGCTACHTVASGETPKGPFLGDIAARYNRTELCESILKPNAKIAQGFETQWFRTKDDNEYEGFVTREGGDDLDVRNAAGATTTLAKKDIAERGKREKSMMPEEMMAKFTPSDLAALLAFLESLKAR